MAFTFYDLQTEVLRRATKNQGGTQFTAGIKNVINTSMWRVAREARWRTLRRTATFTTVAPYTTGTGAVTLTASSASVTVTGATFLTDDIRIGRYIKFSGSTKYFKIATITGETTLTLDQVYDGTSTAVGTYAISGQEEYVLPIQIGHSAFFWHKGYGYPLMMQYNPAQEFYRAGVLDTLQNVPLTYRMWGMGSTLEQLKAPSIITLASSSVTDTSIAVTVFGIVSGYPDYEIITTNSSDGTTSVNGAKTFSSVERITKNQNTIGRITLTSNSANVTVAVLPVGNTTTGPYYTKVQIYPLPYQAVIVNCYYYKLPFQLINDGDVTELGEEFSEAIILLAVAKLKGEQNQSEDADFFKFYQDEITSLKRTNVDKIDWAPKLQSPNDDMANAWTGGLRFAQVGSGGMYGPQ
tara:strand:- start:1001 stop:2227 length:1227 start_codon:yes stop_codon:yes gene_type:complete